MRFTHNSQEFSTGMGVSSLASVVHIDSNVEDNTARGDLHIVSILHTPDSRVEKEMRSILQQKYYTPNTDTAFMAINTAVGEVVHMLRQRQITAEICALSKVENVVYLACSNGSQVVLIRDGNVTPVLSSQEGEVKSASGYIQETDIILLHTKDFSECISVELLNSLLEEASDIESLNELIQDQLVGYKKPLAYNLLQFYEEQVELPVVMENNVNISQPPVKGPKAFVLSLIDKALSVIPDKKMVVKTDTEGPQKSKAPVIAGVALLGILLVSIVFGMKAREEKAIRESYQDELTSAQHEYDEAQSLSGINEIRAKELILSAQNRVSELQERGIEDPQIQVLSTSIEQSLGDIAGIYRQQSEVFLDLSLIRADFQGDDLTFSTGEVGVLDATKERVTLVNVSSKRTKNIGALDLAPNALQLTSYNQRFYLLSSDGIRDITNELALVVRSEEWKADGALIGAFGGNLYVADTQNNMIWRYPGGSSTFGDGQKWLSDGINVNLTNAVSWSIDGRIWILSNGGIITVYDRGVPRRVNLDGITGLDGATVIFADESAENIYILDPVNSRIVVFNKEGVFEAEYKVENLSNVTDFAVSEEEQKIIYLEGNKLWEIALQHLN